MKKRKLIQGGIAILMAIFVLALAGCPQGTEDPQIPPTGTLTIKYGKPVIKANSEKFVDPIWNSVASFPIEKVYENDTNMEFWDGLTKGIGRALWDENGVYVYVKVIDPTVNTSAGSAHERDSVELFINEAVDATNAIVKVPVGNGDKGGQYRVDAVGAASGDPEPAVTAMTTLNKISGWHTDDGYIVIFQAPWRFKEQYPLKDLKKIGFDVQINACSDGSRDGVVVWHNNISQSYQNVTNYGEVTLDATGAPNFEVNAALPVISVQPVNGSYEPTDTATALSVTATVSDGGTLSYQWYSNSANSYDGGTAITGGTNPTYTPPLTNGTIYYWVEVKNQKDNKTSAAVRSNRASVLVAAGVLVEKISTRGSSARAFQFTLPQGKSWADYTKLTYTVMVADQASWDWTSIRMYVAGNYAASDFGADGAHTSGDWGGERMITIADNSTFAELLAAGNAIGNHTTVTDGATGPKDWATIEHPTSVMTGGKGTPSGNGPFIFAFGPTVNPNNHSEQAAKETLINYYIKDVALVDSTGAKLTADTGVNYWTKFNVDFGAANTIMVPEAEMGPPVEKISTRGSSARAFRFTLPSGKSWADYPKLTYTVMVADQASWDWTSIRMYVAGNYAASDFGADGAHTSGDWGGERMITIADNSTFAELLAAGNAIGNHTTVTDGATGPKDWATIEHPTSVMTGGKGTPSGNGPFIFAFGPTVNPNNHSEQAAKETLINYYIKDVALVDSTGAKLTADTGVNYWTKFNVDFGAANSVMAPEAETY